VLATAKHYPGHGDTATDSHRGLPRVDRSRAELEQIDLLPFRAAVAAGVDIVMTAHLLYPALDAANPATMSPAILQDLLRAEMGFQGVILSDSMNMGAIRRSYAPDEAAVLAVLAGVDMIMLAEEHYDHDAAHYLDKQLLSLRGVIAAVQQGRIPPSRVDDAVGRILTLKQRRGLFRAAPASAESVRIVGSAPHQAVALDAARAAVTLVRNTGKRLPLPAAARVALVNATPRASYARMGPESTRGIGPNQSTPAFDSFVTAMRDARPDMDVVPFEAFAGAARLPAALTTADLVLAVTENYPLPGFDFDTRDQRALVQRLVRELGDKLVVIALRDPYELADFPDVSTYLCTCSSRKCAALAAAEVVLGRTAPRGHMPVSVPGVAPAGTGAREPAADDEGGG
jgi:beta-N-acetylhexosaminidase